MNKKFALSGPLLLAIAGAIAINIAFSFSASAQAADAGQQAITKSLGSIKTINGNALTLSADSGSDVAVSVEQSARILRVTPGEKDLKSATAIQIQDLKVGDKVRIRGHATANGLD